MFEPSEQQKMIGQVLRAWCESQLLPKIPAFERGDEMPYELMRKMVKTFGMDQLMGSAVDKRLHKLRAGSQANQEAGVMAGADSEDDGTDPSRDPMLMFVVVKELSRISPGFAMSWGVSVGLAGGAVLARGTAAQIERWGRALATTAKIGSWCLTEPGAGSDAFGSMATTLSWDASRQSGRLNGSKTFITNAPAADLFVVYARVDRGEAREAQPILPLVVERGAPGLQVGQPFKKMGMRDSPTAEVFFDNVEISLGNVLGESLDDKTGRAATKSSLASERSAIPAMAWGIVERAYELSVAYVRERRQFGRAIGEFQAVQLKIADLYLKLKQVENIVIRTAWLQQNGKQDPAFVNVSKAWCSQAAVEAALTAIQLHGGYGYMEEYHLEKLARDAKLLELGAGTTDINLLTAARHLIGLGGSPSDS